MTSSVLVTRPSPAGVNIPAATTTPASAAISPDAVGPRPVERLGDAGQVVAEGAHRRLGEQDQVGAGVRGLPGAAGHLRQVGGRVGSADDLGEGEAHGRILPRLLAAGARRPCGRLAPVNFDSVYDQGFVRMAACTAPVTIADPRANAASVLSRPGPATPRGWRSRCSPSWP